MASFPGVTESGVPTGKSTEYLLRVENVGWSIAGEVKRQLFRPIWARIGAGLDYDVQMQLQGPSITCAPGRSIGAGHRNPRESEGVGEWEWESSLQRN